MISDDLLQFLESATLKILSDSLGAGQSLGRQEKTLRPHTKTLKPHTKTLRPHTKTLRPQELASKLAPAVHNLWQLFNAKRPKKLPIYMNDKSYHQAYMASMFIPNVVKLAGICESPAIKNDILRHLKRNRTSLTIIDFGAGPLTATLALAMSLRDLLEEAKKSVTATAAANKSVPAKPFQLRVLAVESAAPIFETGKAIALELNDQLIRDPKFPLTLEIKRLRLADIEERKLQADLFIAANSLSELTTNTRKDLLKFLAPRIENGMTALLVEPGQDVHSKALAGFRDKILEGSPELVVLAPCEHREKCPLGPDSLKPDWCWFRNTWKRSKWIETLDLKTGLSHDELNYSYVCLAHARFRQDSGWGRIVSDRMALPEQPALARKKLLLYLKANSRSKNFPADEIFLKGKLTKTLVCANEGKLLGMYDKFEEHKGSPQLSPGTKRGELLLRQPANTWTASERTAAEEKSKKVAFPKSPAVVKQIEGSAQDARKKRNSKANVTKQKPGNRPQGTVNHKPGNAKIKK